MSTAEWQEEERRAEHTIRSIELRLGELEREASDVREEVVGIRRQFWDDVTVNLDSDESVLETYASMKQQAEVLSGREQAHRQMAKQLAVLRKLKLSPYFGRVDFAEAELGGLAERIYLGIASFVSDDGIDYLIYDWRAPISSLYYDYEPGPAKYGTPSGTIDGEMKLKRQYVYRGGRLMSMFDSGVTIGDELLMEALGRQSDSHMRSIVATIQREQNRIIRNESAKLLVVTGPAGSGKTSAALQRVAYLLYRNRDSLKADQIVLFSPNPMFNSYVSTVLPELGEENMQQTTYQEYLEYRLDGAFELEDPFEQTEAMLAGGERDEESSVRGAGIRCKAGVGFLMLLDAYVVWLKGEGLRFANVEFQGETVADAETLAQFVYAKDDAWSIPNRLQVL
jgi:DNA helicase-2/ATP-dependent DNA helicase PcrA